MNIYTLKKDAFTLGDEPHPEYGYSWRASVEESDFPIQWSSKKQNWTAGTKIVSKTSEKKTAKSSGKEYMWLTGVDLVEDSGSAGGDNAASATPSTQASGEKRSAVGQDNKFLKDLSDTPKDVFKACLPYTSFDKMLSDESYYEDYLVFVKRTSVELLQMMEDVRSGKIELPEEPQKSGYDQAKATASKLKMSPDEANSFLEEMQ